MGKKTENNVRRQRVHYRPSPGWPILCGTTASRPVSSGDEWQVSCRHCLKCMEARKARGQVDLFGNAA